MKALYTQVKVRVGSGVRVMGKVEVRVIGVRTSFERFEKKKRTHVYNTWF